MRHLKPMLALVVAAMLTIGVATPAFAGVDRRPPAPVSSHVTAHPYVLPCVTTTWRAAYWQLPKTRVGASCYVLPGMWIPKAWPRVGTVVVHGVPRTVVTRTR